MIKAGFRTKSPGGIGSCLRVIAMKSFGARCLAVVLAAASVGSVPPSACASGSEGSRWAILIGVEGYQNGVPPLKFTIRDVSQVAQTLGDRGGYLPSHILELTEENARRDRQPYRSTLLERLPEWLKKPGPHDSVLVYFSGHGFQDKRTGKTYLAPLDVDQSRLAETGVPVEWFRDQLAACSAATKLLIIDSCHAGSEKGDAPTGISAEALGTVFRKLEGVVTIASSTADQSSLIWPERQQSLFSYYLNQGLKGHADSDENGEVDIDELYKYVFRNVQYTASQRFFHKQEPVRIVRSGAFMPVVIELKPQKLNVLLRDMAEQLSVAMEEHRFGKVGVLEFTTDTKRGEMLGGDFGSLGRRCAAEMERRLLEQSDGRFSVIDRARLQNMLAAQHFSIDDLGSPDSLRRLNEAAHGLPVIAHGTIQDRVGRRISIRCKLCQTTSDEVAGWAGGTAVLSPSDWAELGLSASLKDGPGDPSPASAQPLGATPSAQESEQAIEKLDAESHRPHPLADPNFPYRVSIWVEGRERRGSFQGNEYFVPLSQGERYELRVENRTSKVVELRLLVDGLNTLPERLGAKGVQTIAWAQPVALETASAWELDPQLGSVFAVRGFATKLGAEGKLRPFVVVDDDKSLASRARFTEQLGLITAAFYTAVPQTRGTGVLGEEDTPFRTSRLVPKDLLAVVHLRYGNLETWQKAQAR